MRRLWAVLAALVAVVGLAATPTTPAAADTFRPPVMPVPGWAPWDLNTLYYLIGLGHVPGTDVMASDQPPAVQDYVRWWWDRDRLPVPFSITPNFRPHQAGIFWPAHPRDGSQITYAANVLRGGQRFPLYSENAPLDTAADMANLWFLPQYGGCWDGKNFVVATGGVPWDGDLAAAANGAYDWVFISQAIQLRDWGCTHPILRPLHEGTCCYKWGRDLIEHRATLAQYGQAFNRARFWYKMFLPDSQVIWNPLSGWHEIDALAQFQSIYAVDGIALNVYSAEDAGDDWSFHARWVWSLYGFDWYRNLARWIGVPFGFLEWGPAYLDVGGWERFMCRWIKRNATFNVAHMDDLPALPSDLFKMPRSRAAYMQECPR